MCQHVSKFLKRILFDSAIPLLGKVYSITQTSTQGHMYKDIYCSISRYSGKPESTHYLTTREWFHAFWYGLWSSMNSGKRMEGHRLPVTCHVTLAFQAFAHADPSGIPPSSSSFSANWEALLSPSCSEVPACRMPCADPSRSTSGCATTVHGYADTLQGLNSCLSRVINLTVLVVRASGAHTCWAAG